jgi:membrane protease YdiL (CAAX protease family)
MEPKGGGNYNFHPSPLSSPTNLSGWCCVGIIGPPNLSVAENVVFRGWFFHEKSEQIMYELS